MDLEFIRQYKTDTREEIHPTEQEINELNQLIELARNVGSYTYYYNENAPDEAQPGLHDGIVAQDLLKVDGLRAAVHNNINPETGEEYLSVDANQVALATLGYVAALVRMLIKYGGSL